ncbi:TATE DNA transposon, putative [Bodo saltans]|uniref:TATE DNA transposon, putative n=1 Tax=Bodo saltans TaxID=75058 RepID=A0A0S4J3Z2_BODSA|nr:TATE DNA transposon, putative [Bodo saltans]|eukprot:CUG85965.1 TATE DNA transposon, putative [Bodo saltans]
MTVLPMGFRPSAQIAQVITWALIESATALQGIKIISYLDNILILGREPAQVKLARTMILDNATKIGAIFNPEGLNEEPSKVFEFLGEYSDISNTNGTVKASLKTVAKLNSLDEQELFPDVQSPTTAANKTTRRSCRPLFVRRRRRSGQKQYSATKSNANAEKRETGSWAV